MSFLLQEIIVNPEQEKNIHVSLSCCPKMECFLQSSLFFMIPVYNQVYNTIYM